MTDSDRPERPGEDASAAEIAEWMQEDFEAAITEGIREAVDDNTPEDDSEEGGGA